MRVQIEHTTRYSFTEPQARVVQLLRLFPSDTAHQTVVDWRIDVDCDARLRQARDGFGNAVRMLYAEGPLETLAITVSGEVLLSARPAEVDAAVEPLPPALFLRATAATQADEALAAFAAEAGQGSDPAERMAALTAALHARFGVVRDRSGGVVAAREAFARKRAGSRDLAQMLLAAARSLNIPARYVSGYSPDGCAEQSQPVPHGWVEAWLGEAAGWQRFDASTGGAPAEDHVRLAVALDAAGATPIAGARIGAGDEELDVDLSVDRIAPDA